MYWNWSLKVPDLSHLGPIGKKLDAKFDIPGQYITRPKIGQIFKKWDKVLDVFTGLVHNLQGQSLKSHKFDPVVVNMA